VIFLNFAFYDQCVKIKDQSSSLNLLLFLQVKIQDQSQAKTNHTSPLKATILESASIVYFFQKEKVRNKKEILRITNIKKKKN
jgi:hypothetical protein